MYSKVVSGKETVLNQFEEVLNRKVNSCWDEGELKNQKEKARREEKRQRGVKKRRGRE